MKFRESQPMENPEAGSYMARCYSLVDMGSQTHAFGGETWISRDVRISFELPTELMEGRYNQALKGKPFAVHVTTKQSLHPNSKLRQLLEGWAGKKFTKETASTFDPKRLIGMPCRLALIEAGEYINIASISQLGKGEVCPKQVNSPVYFSLEPGEFDQAVFDKLSEKTKEKIVKTTEWHALNSNTPEPTGASADDVPYDPNSDEREPF